MDRQPGPIPGALRMLVGYGFVVLAAVFWLVRSPAASWAAARVSAATKFTTMAEPDDARLFRAFAAAQQRNHQDATLVPRPDGSRVRTTLLWVRGRTEAETLAGLRSLTSSISAEFEKEGPGELRVDTDRRTHAVLDERSALAKHVFEGAATVTFLLAALLLVTGWRRVQASPHRKPAIFWWQLALMLGLPIVFVVVGGAIMILFIMGIPTAIAAKLCYNAMKTRRSARWPSTMARIVESKVRVEHRDDLGAETKAVNVPSITYEFTLGGKAYRGSRISFVEDTLHRDAQEKLDRYPAGATVPVHYNPADPKEAVLEYKLPAPAPVIYAVAGAIFMAGVAATLAFVNLDAIMLKLRAVFPPGAEPHFAIFLGLSTLLLVWIQGSAEREARRAKSWPTTSGRIVSSRVGSYEKRVGGGGQTGKLYRFYSAVVEYAYTVKDRQYHSTQLSFGAQDSTTAKGPADAKAARYPEGSEVVVHYEPRNPGNAVLEVKAALNWLVWTIAAACLALTFYFSAVFR